MDLRVIASIVNERIEHGAMLSGPVGIAVRPGELTRERGEEITKRPCQDDIVVAVQEEHNNKG